MTTLTARLKAAAEDAQRWDTPGAEHELAELLSPSRVIKIVAALEAAQNLQSEIEQAAPLLDLFPDDLAEAMGGMRAALAALDQEEE